MALVALCALTTTVTGRMAETANWKIKSKSAHTLIMSSVKSPGLGFYFPSKSSALKTKPCKYFGTCILHGWLSLDASLLEHRYAEYFTSEMSCSTITIFAFFQLRLQSV